MTTNPTNTLYDRLGLQNILGAIMDSVVMLDPQFRITFATSFFLQTIGRHASEIVGLPFTEALAKNELLKHTGLAVLLKDGSFRSVNIAYAMSDGQAVSLNTAGSVLSDDDGNAVGVLLIAHDDSEIKALMAQESRSVARDRQEAETLAKLHGELQLTRARELKQKTHLDRILAAMTDSMFLLDTDYKVIRVNEVYLNLMGQRSEDIVGRYFIDLLAQDDLINFSGIDHLFANHQFIGVNMAFSTTGHASVTLKASGSLISDEDGESMGAVIIAHDEREMLRLLALESRASAQEREQADILGKLHEELQQTSERELRHSKNLLTQAEKLSQLGGMVASIGHEISNPIMLIAMSEENSTEVLKSLEKKFMPIFTGSPEAEKVGKNLQRLLDELHSINKTIRTGSERLRGLSTALRTQSRMEDEATQGVVLNEVIQESMVLTGGRTKIHTLEESLGDLPLITCYRSKIGQVLTNLLSNAADALSEKAERLKGSEFFEGRINITSTSSDYKGTPGALVTISDNGDGVPPSIRDKIFNEFFTTKPAGRGTGLGLSMCLDIVKEHQGVLKVDQDPVLKGARFELWLPSNNQ